MMPQLEDLNANLLIVRQLALKTKRELTVCSYRYLVMMDKIIIQSLIGTFSPQYNLLIISTEMESKCKNEFERKHTHTHNNYNCKIDTGYMGIIKI